MADKSFDLGRLVRQELLTREWIAPTIYRLATSRKAWGSGGRAVQVSVRLTPEADTVESLVEIVWNLDRMAADDRYVAVRDDLRKLAKTKNDENITELAALGTAFGLMTLL